MIAKSLSEGGRVGRFTLIARLPASEGTEAWIAGEEGEADASVPVLLRAIPDCLVGDPTQAARLREELRWASACEHPHLTRLRSLAETENGCFLVTDFVSGRTLRQIQTRAGTFQRIPPLWFTLHVGAVVCDALGYLHARCRDFGTPLASLRHPVTPDTITVSFAGDPKLLAFGFGLPSAPATTGATGRINRVFRYTAPERLTAPLVSPEACARADVYSLGVVLYEALTGRRPFQTDDEENLLREVLDERRDLVPPSVVAPWVTKPLEAIVSTALERDPEARFRDATELGDALSRYMAWAGLQPHRRHVARQVCGVVSHADSEPPPSARSDPDERPFLVFRSPRPARVTAALGVSSDFEAEISAAAAQRPSGTHAWDLATAQARSPAPPQRDGSREPPAPLRSARPVPRPSAEPRHFWDRIVEQQRTAASTPDESDRAAVHAFEAGLELARKGDFASALTQLEEALRLDPGNRVYGANLRRVQRELDRAAD